MSPSSPLPRTPIPVGDLAARRIVALTRVACALAVASTASVEALDVPTWAAWFAGIVWLPFAAWALFAEEGPADPVRTWASYAVDLTAITVLMLAMPESADLIAIVSIPLAAVVTYRSGGVVGLVMGGAVLVAWELTAMTALQLSADDDLLAARAISVAAVTILVSRALAVQRRDASSVRHLAQRSDLILQRSAEGVVVTDATGRIILANPAAHSAFTADSHDGLLGMACADLELRTSSGPLDCARSCALASLCHDGQDIEVWRQVGDQRQPFLASASVLATGSGEREHLHSFRDITKLRMADEAKTMFLSTASHELKTPLTVIRGFTQILNATVTDPSARIALEAIDTRSAELVAIVDRLLLSSRIESGRIELTTEPVDVGRAVHGCVAEMGATLGRAIEVDAPEGTLAVASREALSTVLTHLLANAVKYSPDGGAIAVTVRTHATAVLIDVADQGIGMPPEHAAQCFDRFWQAEASDVRRFGGTGVGLYIVKSLVEGMGGQVDVSSSLGEGSTFTVALQLADDAPAPTREPDDTAAGDRSSVDEFMHHLGLPTGGN